MTCSVAYVFCSVAYVFCSVAYVFCSVAKEKEDKSIVKYIIAVSIS